LKGLINFMLYPFEIIVFVRRYFLSKVYTASQSAGSVVCRS